MHNYLVRFSLILFVTLSCIPGVSGQSIDYTFDACNLQDANSILSPLTPNQTEECRCGVQGDGLYCDGTDLYYEFEQAFKDFFEEPTYTLRFSFLPQKFNEEQALFSLMKDCSRDSMLSVQYLPQSDEIEILISNKLGDSWAARGKLKENQCWHEVAISKSNSLYALYVDNVFIESFDNLSPFQVSPSSRVYLGFSPCVDMDTDNVFEGIIDDFSYTRDILSAADLASIALNPDLIINNDTTIISGASVDVISGPSCATTATWSPQNGVSDISAIAPTIAPDETTLYFRELSHNGCTLRDSFIINIIEKSSIDCDRLLLPNVFTPNGDNVNDIYKISNLFIIEEMQSFEIFNRWGESVFLTSQRDEGWTGLVSGSPAQIGMYVYRVSFTCQGEQQESVGSFSLMR